MSSPWDRPTATCPYCGTTGCEADWCDVEVGYQQVGPYYCENCGATSVGTYDENIKDEDEKRTGWFKPGHLGITVNTFQGKPVSHQTAKSLYEMGLLDEKKELTKLN